MKVFTRILDLSVTAAGLILFFLAAMTTADVFKRWITNRSFTGVYEYSGVLFVALTFLAIATVQYRQRQITMDMLVTHLKGKIKLVLSVVSDFLVLGFFAVILWRAVDDWIGAYKIGDVTYGMIKIPLVVYISLLGYGLVLICACLLIALGRNVRAIFHSPEKNPHI